MPPDVTMCREDCGRRSWDPYRDHAFDPAILAYSEMGVGPCSRVRIGATVTGRRETLSGSNGWFGRYRVDRRIGTGGMSQAWRGQLESRGGFRKLVVIKVMHPEHVDDPEFVRMFMDEARLTARLSHANIAQVFEAGEQAGAPFIVMEHVAGPDLTHVVKRLRGCASRPFGVAARILAGMCRGLHAAHTQTDEDGRPLRIIHRDVSLGNVVLAATGTPKLIDFGIARWQERSTVTEIGLLKGKLHYMAPEQLRSGYDHRVDIYQAGVCLYWLTTGRPPFAANDPLQLWRERLRGDFPRPSEVVPGYPPALERVLLRAMATDPRDRFATAAEMASALEGFCAPGGGWATTDAAVARWLQTLFSPEEWEEWRPPRFEVEQTDLTPAPPEDYRGDDDTAGARAVRAFRDGRYLSVDSLAGDLVAAADPDAVAPLDEADAVTTPGVLRPVLQNEAVTRADLRPPLASVPAASRGVVIRSAHRQLPAAQAQLPRWMLLLAGVAFVVIGLALGWRMRAPEALGAERLDAAARVYLDEASALETSGDLDGAKMMLGRARAVGSTDPALDVALTRLERELGLIP